MLIKTVKNVTLEPVQEGIGIRWVISEKDGAPNFAMRVIEIEPGVRFEPHHHPYEHEIYVLEGEGILLDDKGEAGKMVPGTALLVPPDAIHGYRNPGTETLKFICVIPRREA